MAKGTSHGAVLKIDVSATMTAIPGLEMEEFDPGTLQLEDVTDHDAVDAKEYLPVPVREIPPLAFNLQWDEADSAHTQLETNYKADTLTDFELTEKSGDTVTFSAYITMLKWLTPVNGVKRRAVELQIQGGSAAALTYS